MSALSKTRFKKVGGVKVIPVTLKIVVVIALFILLSNLATNYVSLVFNRVHQISFSKQLLIKDLKDLSNFINIQWQISQLDSDEKGVIENIRKKSQFELKNKSSIFLGIQDDGKVKFSSLKKNDSLIKFDPIVFKQIKQALKQSDKQEDFINVKINNKEYFGIYKYNKNWDVFLFRGEEYQAFFKDSWKSFQQIILIIIFISIASIITGVFVVRYLLRFIGIITESIMQMVEQQKMSIIPLQNAPNDDVTYMGMAFNSLSNTIDNLISIFTKFTDRDIVAKAYEQKSINLEGEQKELAILFTDIKGYTNMTETLGADIIKLINIQYNQAINHIYRYDGIIASIIGDALLAVYGVMPTKNTNKSYEAVLSAFDLIEATEQLQEEMRAKKIELIEKKGKLSEEEEKIYQAVLVEVGVGIDGGNVFYGTIGSQLRMTTTVIGDRVNSASRLEGLTRFYKVPVICSKYIKDDIENNVDDCGFTFINIDTVQVKGKTEGVEIYWPIPDKQMSDNSKAEISQFSKALDLYYEGRWSEAKPLFDLCLLPVADVFKQRTSEPCPSNWQGIWVLNRK